MSDAICRCRLFRQKGDRGAHSARRRWIVSLAVVVVLAIPLTASCLPHRQKQAAPGSAAGQLLVASRQMNDPHFARTVIYVVAHDGDGAFGLVVNRLYGQGSLQVLLDAFDLPAPSSAALVRLHYGGPVEPERGFVLHSPDYGGESTIELSDSLSFSTGRDVLEAIAAGKGPKRVLVILGYAGWAPGQLDGEIARGDWLLAPADASLIFGDDLETTWERALQGAGIPL